MRALKGYRRLAPRTSRGPLPWSSCSRNDGCGNGGERRGVCSDACCPIHSSSAGCPRHSLGEVHNKRNVYDTTLELISNKLCRGFRQINRGRGTRDHNASFLSPGSVVGCAPANTVVDGNSKTRQMAQQEKRQQVRKARSVAQGNLDAVRCHAKAWTTGDEPHVAAAQWRSATSSSRVDKNGSQSCVISETRCRAKLHGIFKQAQRHNKDGRIFLLLGRSDQLVGGQIARLSSLGIVILSEVLSPGFYLKSFIVRNVLRGSIAHGDTAAVWMTRPLTSSTAACHQANVVGFYAELCSDSHRQSLVHWATNNIDFQQVPVDLCAFGLQFQKRFTLFSVNVPVHLQLARRCDDSGHVCSRSGKTHRQLGSCFQNRFSHRPHRVRFSIFIARALVHSLHAKDSWRNKQRWLG